MVAYNDNPDLSRDYHRPSHESADSKQGASKHSSFERRGSIDGVVLSPATNELYQNRNEPFLKPDYELVQPLWFEAVMRKLAEKKCNNPVNLPGEKRADSVHSSYRPAKQNMG